MIFRNVIRVALGLSWQLFPVYMSACHRVSSSVVYEVVAYEMPSASSYAWYPDW